MTSKSEHVRGDVVIARTNRGLERGEVISTIPEGADERVSNLATGTIQRLASPMDENENRILSERAKGEFENCERLIRDSGLKMTIVDIEFIFGGEIMVIYYTADDRVDFRELVKKLAANYRTRIEMRQVGARDEARLMADFGDCGMPVCCNTYLSQIPSVSMRMAKLQKATLDPNKISGRCGRLKCCLRFEQDNYEELMSQMPPIGSDIVTPQGRAKVLGMEILAQELHIATEDNRRISIPVGDCLSILKRGADTA